MSDQSEKAPFKLESFEEFYLRKTKPEYFKQLKEIAKFYKEHSKQIEECTLPKQNMSGQEIFDELLRKYDEKHDVKLIESMEKAILTARMVDRGVVEFTFEDCPPPSTNDALCYLQKKGWPVTVKDSACRWTSMTTMLIFCYLKNTHP